MLTNIYNQMPQYGSGYSNWVMLALNFNLPFYELAIMGDDALKQHEELGQHYTPKMVIAGGNERSIPFLEDKPRTEETMFYICEGYVCKAPLMELDGVLEEMR